MKFGILPRVSFSLLLGLFVGGSDTFAASVDADLEKAGKEAEAKGYAFITSHEEIVTKAKMEGGLRVLAEMQAANIKASTAAFIKKYRHRFCPAQHPRNQERSGNGLGHPSSLH